MLQVHFQYNLFLPKRHMGSPAHPNRQKWAKAMQDLSPPCNHEIKEAKHGTKEEKLLAAKGWKQNLMQDKWELLKPDENAKLVGLNYNKLLLCPSSLSFASLHFSHPAPSTLRAALEHAPFSSDVLGAPSRATPFFLEHLQH
jgi:hypothetical protein